MAEITTNPDLERAEADIPEQVSRRQRARSYFGRNPRAKWLLLFVVVLIAVGGYFVWRHYAAQETTDDAQIQGHLIYVSAKVGGTVEKIMIKDNQYVEAGTVLVQIDPRDYKIAVDRAQAELADAQAQASGARSGVPITSRTTQSQVATATAGLSGAKQDVQAEQARVAAAEANYNKAAADLKRMQQLIAKDEISQQQFDTAIATEKAARATLDAARAALSTAQSRVSQAEAQLSAAHTAPEQVSVTQSRARAAEAMVQQKQAALDQAKLNLEYTTVRAPSNGIVRKSVEEGQLVQAGQPLVSVVPLDDIWVIANFKETQLKNMHPGQKASIHVDAYDKDYDGHVDSIGGATAAAYSLLPPENATGNYVKVIQRVPVKIFFENGQDPQHLLRPGMSVEATVYVK